MREGEEQVGNEEGVREKGRRGGETEGEEMGRGSDSGN